MLRVALLALAVAAVLASANSVTVTQCQDGQCSTGCQTTSFPENECLTLEGTSNTVTLSCFAGSAMCNNLQIFPDDSTCTDQSQMIDYANVCSACNPFNSQTLGFSVSCGALHDAAFIAYNCTLSSTCNDCSGAIIVPFGACKAVPNLGYAKLTTIASCVGVQYTTFFNSNDCSGTAANSTTYYQSGKCADGNVFTCSS